MKDINPKQLALIEIVIALVIGLFAIDFTPRNYNEFQRICSQTWPTDQKQYQTCMKPYFDQTNLDKYAIGVGVAVLVLIPALYFFKKKKF